MRGCHGNVARIDGWEEVLWDSWRFDVDVEGFSRVFCWENGDLSVWNREGSIVAADCSTRTANSSLAVVCSDS
jgi:hypothetical protein